MALLPAPNYFYEWMVWNGLAIAALPSWLAMQSNENAVIWGLLGIGLVFTSWAMYKTLVYTTGAVPSSTILSVSVLATRTIRRARIDFSGTAAIGR